MAHVTLGSELTAGSDGYQLSAIGAWLRAQS